MGKKDAYINPNNVACIFQGNINNDIISAVFILMGAVMLQTTYSTAEECYEAIYGTSILKSD
jgi:hypothetical protein